MTVVARAVLLSWLALRLTVTAETVNDCIESKCRGCGGEQCQLCREDKNTISACVSSCMDTICKGCGGEQCQLCREDAKTVESCCSEQVLATVTADIDMCKATPKDPCDGLYGAEGLQCAWEEDVKSCMASSCQGCGGEQCQLCREDAERINTCCQNHWHSVDPPQMCKDAEAELEPKDPCSGLYGAEGLQCAWEEDAKSCVESSCQGCGGEQCQLCRQDAQRIASCCDEHYHSVDPPQMCKTSKEEAVTTCMDNKCHGCGGEQCQLCREDAKSECCTGAMRTPSCESSKALLP
eukprot:Skav216694  [mRNA]  locus=scaffold91:253554:254435:+ [translate_table: standard]